MDRQKAEEEGLLLKETEAESRVRRKVEEGGVLLKEAEEQALARMKEGQAALHKRKAEEEAVTRRKEEEEALEKKNAEKEADGRTVPLHAQAAEIARIAAEKQRNAEAERFAAEQAERIAAVQARMAAQAAQEQAAAAAGGSSRSASAAASAYTVTLRPLRDEASGSGAGIETEDEKNDRSNPEFTEIFCWFDADRDGSITESEFAAAMRAFVETFDGIPGDQKETALQYVESISQQIIEKVDANGNGTLEFPEFLKYLETLTPDQSAHFLKLARKASVPSVMEEEMLLSGDVSSFEEAVSRLQKQKTVQIFDFPASTKESWSQDDEGFEQQQQNLLQGLQGSLQTAVPLPESSQTGGGGADNAAAAAAAAKAVAEQEDRVMHLAMKQATEAGAGDAALLEEAIQKLQAMKQATEAGKKVDSAPLPDGWEEFVDAKYQIPYFYNAATGEKLYERPEAVQKKALLREALNQEKSSAVKAYSAVISAGAVAAVATVPAVKGGAAGAAVKALSVTAAAALLKVAPAAAAAAAVAAALWGALTRKKSD